MSGSESNGGTDGKLGNRHSHHQDIAVVVVGVASVSAFEEIAAAVDNSRLNQKKNHYWGECFALPLPKEVPIVVRICYDYFAD